MDDLSIRFFRCLPGSVSRKIEAGMEVNTQTYFGDNLYLVRSPVLLNLADVDLTMGSVPSFWSAPLEDRVKCRNYVLLLCTRCTGMTCPRVADGGNSGNSLQIWRIAANVSDKQSWTVDKRCFSSSGIGRGGGDNMFPP